MAKAQSVDLWKPVLAAVAEIEAVVDVAERFEVTPRTIRSWLALQQASGSLEPHRLHAVRTEARLKVWKL